MMAPPSARPLLALGLVVAVTITALPATGAGAAAADSATKSAAAARGEVNLPPGWRVSTAGGSSRLVWRSEEAIPFGDARIQFWLGDRLLGTPRPAPDGRSFSLPLSSPLLGAGQSLHVTKNGRPLDRNAQSRRRTTDDPRQVPQQSTRLSVVDPGTPGPYGTRTDEYTIRGVQVADLPDPVEVQGVVVRPRGTAQPRPLVLLLHGRHSTCFRGGPEGRSSSQWPCPPRWQPIPSFRGYLETQQLLASQGYVTVSISANGINGQDYQAADGGAQARSELVRHHLDLLSRWTRRGGGPLGASFEGAVDPQHVMLVGHSRGGEGANRAAVDATSADRWRVDGQLLIGPTAFGQQTAPGVDTAVLLPFCDGDVSDLQGQAYIDEAQRLTAPLGDPALRSAVLVMGANHNYFNSEWTPGVAAAPSWDDWGSPKGVCGSRTSNRLSAAEQRTVGAVYVATAAQAFIADAPRALALLDGSPVRPASLGGATTLTTATGADRTPVVAFGPNTRIRGANANATVCLAYRVDEGQHLCAPHVDPWAQPHFLRMFTADDAPPGSGLRMGWRRPDARVRVDLAQPVDLTRSSSLELRVAVNPQSDKARVGVTIGDGRGRTAELGSRVLYPLPGNGGLSKLWAQNLRLRLPDRPAINLGDIQFVRLTGESGSGRIVVLDVQGRAPGPSANSVPTMPLIDVLDTTVREGDGPEKLATVTLQIGGEVRGGERFYVEGKDLNARGTKISQRVQLTPGQSTVTVDFPIAGDTRDDHLLQIYFGAKAMSGIVTGDYLGVLTVRDDDPRPSVLVDATTTTAAEGTDLTWNVRLSEPSDKYVGLVVGPVPSGVNELTVADLAKRFRRQYGLQSVPDQTKLSETSLRFDVSFAPGQVKGKWILPTATDDVVEGPESVTLRQSRRNQIPLPSDLYGTLTDVSASQG